MWLGVSALIYHIVYPRNEHSNLKSDKCSENTGRQGMKFTYFSDDRGNHIVLKRTKNQQSANKETKVLKISQKKN